MITLAGSTAIPLIGIIAAWLMHHHLRLAWWLLLLNQCIWIIYGSLTGQWGFIVGAVFTGSGYVNALRLQHEPPLTNADLIAICKVIEHAENLYHSGDQSAFDAAFGEAGCLARAALAGARS